MLDYGYPTLVLRGLLCQSKNDMSEEGFFASNNKSKIIENCQCDVKWTMQSLQSVDSYSELLKEIPANGLKSRKDKLSMKKTLESHYLNAHGSRLVRGGKRKLIQED